ncbi:MAG: hypothetical protein FWC14_06620 [Candidatus Bathyarchaeota archaeon]|uniref:hypothetical protein n=1 Tax=Candidatus Bathycorpusculum sp. TaxID=2994959 RepID=UPI00281DB15A|nr:hypothetical protein [Candidatus Termiticorpusculum sp.]
MALVLLVALQIIVVSSFQPIVARTCTDESVTVVISKLGSVHLRVEVSITALESNVVLLFSNGTQKEVPAFSLYTFSVIMPRSGFYLGSYGFQSEGITLSDNQPVDVEFLSNCTLTQTPYSNMDWLGQDYPRVSVYCFTVTGSAMVSVEGMSAVF